jgi:hypothetical protein
VALFFIHEGDRIDRMKKNTKVYKEILIPHVGMTVLFMDMSQLNGNPKETQGAGYTAIFGENTIGVFIEDIEKSVTMPERFPYFAHEVVHVLQIICEKFAMRFENEIEHMAYLMHYILQEVLQNK